MANIPLTRIQLRRGDTTEWTQDRDIVLGRGEPATEFYTADSSVNGVLAGTIRGMKVGDGVSKYHALPFFVPDRGVKANNRPMRDLSGFNTIQNQTAGKDFDSILSAMEKILFPYEAPSFNFDGDKEHTIEVGRAQSVTLTMYNIRSGSFPLIKKRILDADSGAQLGIQLPVGGQTTVANTDYALSGVNVVLNTFGSRTFRGEVTNARDTADGPDVQTRDTRYDFRYPVIKGLATSLPAGYNPAAANGGLTEAQWSAYLNSNFFSRNLGGAGQEVRGAVTNSYAVIAVPVIYQNGYYTSISQNGDPIPVASINSLFASHTTPLGTAGGASLGGSWSNVSYRIMVQRAPAGNGSFEYLWAFNG